MIGLQEYEAARQRYFAASRAEDDARRAAVAASKDRDEAFNAVRAESLADCMTLHAMTYQVIGGLWRTSEYAGATVITDGHALVCASGVRVADLGGSEPLPPESIEKVVAPTRATAKFARTASAEALARTIAEAKGREVTVRIGDAWFNAALIRKWVEPFLALTPRKIAVRHHGPCTPLVLDAVAWFALVMPLREPLENSVRRTLECA